MKDEHIIKALGCATVPFLVADRLHKITDIYTDGGTINGNPSPIGGMWAFVGIDKFGTVLISASGLTICRPEQMVSNNHTEMMAIIKALEAMPPDWNGRLHSDSKYCLNKLKSGKSWLACPPNLFHRMLNIRSKFRHLLSADWVKAHPSVDNLIDGHLGDRPDALVSALNVLCDYLCAVERHRYFKALERDQALCLERPQVVINAIDLGIALITNANVAIAAKVNYSGNQEPFSAAATTGAAAANSRHDGDDQSPGRREGRRKKKKGGEPEHHPASSEMSPLYTNLRLSSNGRYAEGGRRLGKSEDVERKHAEYLRKKNGGTPCPPAAAAAGDVLAAAASKKKKKRRRKQKTAVFSNR